jgi:hypothetical protein
MGTSRPEQEMEIVFVIKKFNDEEEALVLDWKILAPILRRLRKGIRLMLIWDRVAVLLE